MNKGKWNGFYWKNRKYKYKKGYQKTTFKGKSANVQAGRNLVINSGNSITVKGSNLEAKEDATLQKGDILVRYVKRDSLKYYKGNKYTLDNDPGKYMTKPWES